MKKVFVNGTFDLIHMGHLELLNFAKAQGDYLLVALDDDNRVRKLKGPNRPINNLKTRLAIMENFRAVDRVIFFGSNHDLINIIKNYTPDIMIVGSDYRDKPVIGCEYAKELVFFDRIPEYSSTKTIQNIANR